MSALTVALGFLAVHIAALVVAAGVWLIESTDGRAKEAARLFFKSIKEH